MQIGHTRGRSRTPPSASGLVRSHSVYGLAKAALIHLTESMAVEFASHVTVNAVVPSQIASARTDRMPAYKPLPSRAQPPGVPQARSRRRIGLT